MKQTDWTAYYQQKKSWFATFTQKFTLKYIEDFITESGDDSIKKRILEIGGGNSCFVDDLVENRDDILCYTIIDSNEYAVELFEKKSIGGVETKGVLMDISERMDSPEKQYDFVYSVGLVEHFDKSIQENVIENHFNYCKKGGYVLITFPTPTLKYRFFRKGMEILGKWQFHDEIPMWIDDIRDVFEKFGNVVLCQDLAQIKMSGPAS